MNISKDVVDLLEQKLGQKPTEARLRKWLVELHLPERGIGSEDFAPPALSGENLVKAREVIKRATQELPAISKPRQFGSFDEAAIVLMGVLEQAHQDTIREIALEMGHPIWVIMLAAVQRAADSRELNAVDVQSDWLNQPGKVEMAKAVVTCHAEGCGLEIPSARRGQVYCCNAHGSSKAEHSVGCPAALAAGIDVSPKVETPVEQPKLETPLVATGTCHFCNHPILNGRAGQLYCCNGCGVSKAHSDTCETGKALAAEDV